MSIDIISSSTSEKISNHEKSNKQDLEINIESCSSIEENSENTIINEKHSNPFLNPKIEEYYRTLYKNSNYESYSAFDPFFNWSPKEEKTVKIKLYYRVAFTACLMFISLQIDRGNLAQAVTDNFLKDLNLNSNDYNIGNTLSLVFFMISEVPSQLISKRLGPDIFIPIQICCWSIVSISQIGLKDKAGFYITRALIGLLQGGFIADLVLWLSYFFTSSELPLVLSWFWVSLSLCQIVSSLLAFGILRINTWGWAGWKFLFLIEGSFSLVVGIASFHLMVPSAVQTKKFLNPKGWFTDREIKIVVNRILRDDPSKGTMHNRQPISSKMLWKCLCDYHLWPIYLIGFYAFMGINTFTPYFGLITKSLGFSTFNTNLLTIPQAILHIIFLLLITWFSEFINDRGFVCLIAPVYATPIIGIIRWWPQAGKNIWGTYVLNTLFLGQPFIHAICVSWVSRNSNSVRSRSISSALYNMFGQIGNIIANFIYRNDDKPLYLRGNMQLFWITFGLIPLLLIIKFYYVFVNKKRNKIWNNMSEDEKDDYRKYTKDEGSDRLDFRFAT
ncbi:uncharacterized protein KGF55_002604 [Candida pseudojiufengensis]|uniref:uncharacterized protein n=1 Tax=Candida pseudojiufengensis TaxID=497109 RepID=UPI002224A0C2|nr:uncharacterized protein KGF55_002604 [Candida pseudojiufengensis]KAI5963724.1 hypothetical protein KGF55_002604 [Candida pseudojiufengensis]